MGIKAQRDSNYTVFYEEMIKILKEQEKFQESLELKVALAEAIDPVQDICF